MKTVILCFALLSGVAHAQEDDAKGAMFEEAKAKLLSAMDSRITNIQNAKGCISQATNRDAIKACRAKLKDDNQALKNQMKTEHAAIKEQRQNLKATKQAARKK